jgi:hypothetical protein
MACSFYGPNICTEGGAISSGDYSGQPKEDAFDGTTAEWQSNSYSMPEWIGQDFGAGNSKRIEKVRLRLGGQTLQGPENFQIHGSDESDFSSYDVLHSEVGENWTTSYQWKEYEFENETSYRYYRVYCTLTQATDYYFVLSEVEMMECGLTSIQQISINEYVKGQLDFTGEVPTAFENLTITENTSLSLSFSGLLSDFENIKIGDDDYDAMIGPSLVGTVGFQDQGAGNASSLWDDSPSDGNGNGLYHTNRLIALDQPSPASGSAVNAETLVSFETSGIYLFTFRVWTNNGSDWWDDDLTDAFITLRLCQENPVYNTAAWQYEQPEISVGKNSFLECIIRSTTSQRVVVRQRYDGSNSIRINETISYDLNNGNQVAWLVDWENNQTSLTFDGVLLNSNSFDSNIGPDIGANFTPVLHFHNYKQDSTVYFDNFTIIRGDPAAYQNDKIAISEVTAGKLDIPGNIGTFFDGVAVSENVDIAWSNWSPVVDDDIGVEEFVNMQLFFAFLYPESLDNITISENVDVGFYEYTLYINQAEGIGVFEFVGITPLDIWGSFNFENVALVEHAQIFLDVLLNIPEVLGISDTITAFNWSTWWAANKYKVIDRYFLTITGAADATTDYTVPVKNFSATKRNGNPTYLSATIPSYNFINEISARPNGELVVKIGYELDGEIVLTEEILRTGIDDMRPDEGGENRSITLSGTKTETFTPQIVTFERPTYRSVQSGNLVYRFARLDPWVNPGDTARVDDDEFAIDYITYMVNESQTLMEIREG